MGQTVKGLDEYFTIITIASFVVTIGAIFQARWCGRAACGGGAERPDRISRLVTATPSRTGEKGVALSSGRPRRLCALGDRRRAMYIISSGTPLSQFQERPPTPPSSSAGAKALAACEDGGGAECDADEHNGGEGLNADNFFTTAGQLLRQPAFLCPLVAFVASISISNVVSAFLEVREIPPTPDEEDGRGTPRDPLATRCGTHVSSGMPRPVTTKEEMEHNEVEAFHRARSSRGVAFVVVVIVVVVTGGGGWFGTASAAPRETRHLGPTSV